MERCMYHNAYTYKYKQIKTYKYKYKIKYMYKYMNKITLGTDKENRGRISD